jgi:hypothetical protein
MMTLFENKLTRYALIACGILVAAILACVIARKGVDTNNTNYAYDIARRLGYTDQSLLVFHHSCWDVGCGIFIHYTTHQSANEFTDSVNRLMFSGGPPMNSISSPVIFTDINTFTNNTLTVDGNTPFGNPNIKNTPKERRWRLKDQTGRIFNIKYYNLLETGGVYELNGKRVTGNIVTIILQTR